MAAAPAYSASPDRALLPALDHEHDVRAVSRRPRAAQSGRTHWEVADAGDAASLRTVLEGTDVVYYLVHSLGSPDFEERDRACGGDRRPRGRARRSHPAHLPGWTGRRRTRAVAASAQPDRDRPAPGIREGPGDSAARGHDPRPGRVRPDLAGLQDSVRSLGEVRPRLGVAAVYLYLVQVVLLCGYVVSLALARIPAPTDRRPGQLAGALG
jgi:hypothetical protein